jgi:hypothetical protein
MIHIQEVFKGKLAIGTYFVGLTLEERTMLDVQWKDAISNAAITLETTGAPEREAPLAVAGDASLWKAEATVITGPNGTAINSSKTHITTLAPCRARLRIVAAAACDLAIYATTNIQARG